MTACHAILTVFAACSLLAAPAGAQPVAAQVTTVGADLKLPVAQRGRATTPATTITAAGSVVVLADGIVAHARIAAVQPPAPGFQYER